MRKTGLILLLALTLGACGKTAPAEDQNRVVVGKEGDLTVTTIGSFTADYFDVKEMRKMIEEELSAYNAEDTKIELKKCSASRGVAEVILYYRSAADYTAYNGERAYFGPLSDAIASGVIPGNQDLISADGDLRTTAEELTTEEYLLFVITESMEVDLPKEVLFFGGSAVKNAEGTLFAGDEKAKGNRLSRAAYFIIRM